VPKVGTFTNEYDTTTPSKVKTPRLVPETPPTVSSKEPRVDCTDPLLHEVDVADVQDAEKHMPNARPDEAVKSTFPKERPDTVTALPPLSGLFRAAAERTAMSKENTMVFVPTVVPTVTAAVNNGAATVEDLQATLVLVVQAFVSHIADARVAELVQSRGLKLRPVTVTELLPEVAAFPKAYDTTGASKLKVENPVAATAPTVT